MCTAMFTTPGIAVLVSTQYQGYLQGLKGTDSRKYRECVQLLTSNFNNVHQTLTLRSAYTTN